MNILFIVIILVISGCHSVDMSAKTKHPSNAYYERSNQILVDEFNRINELCFNNELKAVIIWSDLGKPFGMCMYGSPPIIYINRTITNNRILTGTIAHEMIHAYLGRMPIGKDPHGDEFVEWCEIVSRKLGVSIDEVY